MKALKIIGITLLLVSCSEEKNSPHSQTQIKWAESSAKFLADQPVDEALIQSRVADMNAFGSRLIGELQAKNPEANQLISSPSIQNAFALLYPATNHADAQEIADVMGFGAKKDFYGATRGLAMYYDYLNQTYENLKLENHNNVWSSQTLNLQTTYLDTIKSEFNAKVALMDFSKAEESRQTINKYIADKTNQLIKELLPKGFISPLSTTTVLTNALYLKSPWLEAFSEAATKPMVFKTPDGEKTLPFLRNEGHYRSNLRTDQHSFDAVSLPLEGNIAMMFMKTRTDDWRNLQQILADENFWQHDFKSLIDSLQSDQIKVSIPKTKIETATTLKNPLKTLGLSQVFAPSFENFSLLYQEKMELFISDIVHSTVLVLDEKGVEAAAATAIGIGTTSAPPPAELSFDADEPCVIVIYDQKYGSVLFLGMMTNPT